MLKFPELRSQYVSFIQEYKAQGNMSLVTNPAVHGSRFEAIEYVYKLRVAFDASCTTTSQLSLNDLLLVGPTVQTDLYLQLLNSDCFNMP